jgi:hypothetical protein
MGVWKKFHRWLFFAAYHINVGKRFEKIRGTSTGVGGKGTLYLSISGQIGTPTGVGGEY